MRNTYRFGVTLFLLSIAIVYTNVPAIAQETSGSKIAPGYLINTEELASLIGKPDVVIVDARAEEKYRKFHLPDAVNIPKKLFRTKHDIEYKNANGFAIPSKKAEMVFGAAGIGPDTRVIVYDSIAFPDASIIWALLKYFGHDNALILKGGYEGWVIGGRPVTDKTKEARKADFTAKPRPEMVADAKWIMENRDKIALLDLRSFAEHLGINPAGNKRGGSIPGSINIEWAEFAGGSTVKPVEEIKRILEKYNVPKDKEIVTYCNWGIGRSTYGFFLLKMLGYEKVRIYGGSMEDWSAKSDTEMGDMKNIPANI